MDKKHAVKHVFNSRKRQRERHYIFFALEMRFAWVGGLQYREVHPRCPPAHLYDAPAGAGPEVILSRMIFHCILINLMLFS